MVQTDPGNKLPGYYPSSLQDLYIILKSYQNQIVNKDKGNALGSDAPK